MLATALPHSSALSRDMPQDRMEPVVVETSAGAVTLLCCTEIEGLRASWEELQAVAPCSSAQTFLWARAWARHVLLPKGLSPAVAVGYGPDGRPLFLWPFEPVRVMGVPVLRWLGQEHANYNLGLFCPGTGEALGAEDLSRLLSAAADQFGAAAAVFESQPVVWNGVANPFAALPHQRAPNHGYAVTLGDFDALYRARFGSRSRSQLARKERKLAGFGTLDYGWGETRQDCAALLDIFFAQKAKQFAQMGVTDPFEPCYRDFYHEVHPSRATIQAG